MRWVTRRWHELTLAMRPPARRDGKPQGIMTLEILVDDLAVTSVTVESIALQVQGTGVILGRRGVVLSVTQQPVSEP